MDVDRQGEWFKVLIEQLAHDLPIDVALLRAVQAGQDASTLRCRRLWSSPFAKVSHRRPGAIVCAAVGTAAPAKGCGRTCTWADGAGEWHGPWAKRATEKFSKELGAMADELEARAADGAWLSRDRRCDRRGRGFRATTEAKIGTPVMAPRRRCRRTRSRRRATSAASISPSPT